MIEPGTRIGGFEVDRLIGKGGMASVFLATQLRLRRPVALKILSPALAADDQFVQRFQLEGVNAARLEHPNIVPVYEAGEDGPWVYLAMKYVEGETLAQRVHRERGMRPDDALPVLADVARALEYAHTTGFVHRDVKPGNVLISQSGAVYLSDFGLSKAMGARGLTSTGQWMGTAEYMAPEQAQAGPLDYRADLYALGCMAFECLTGDPPYLADTPVAVILAHLNDEVPSATARNLSLPPGVDAVLGRAMAKQPEERYRSALGLVESLAAALEERRLDARAEPADEVRRFARAGYDLSAFTVPPPPEDVQWPTSAPPTPRVDEATSPAPPPEPVRAPPSLLFCPGCVGPLDAEDRFCGTCGSRIEWCVSCGGPVVSGDRFCQHCGASAGT